MRTAPNILVPFGINISGYPKPRIDHVAHRRMTVDTSLGPRPATEVTITGAHFAVRAVSPDVRVNGLDLVSFRIANDTSSITGYLFEELPVIHHVMVDYGLGARGEWSRGGAAGGTHQLALILLLATIILAIIFLAIGILPLVWIALTVAVVLAIYVAFF